MTGNASASDAKVVAASVGAVDVGTGRAVTVAALAGFCCMAAELTAVRLQAPWFGDSAYVWTNVIGVILAALAGGAALGGILAGRGSPASWLFRALGLAGLMLALLPFLAFPLGQWLLPADLPLDAAMAAIVRGSLVATALLFAPPMLLLGAIGPLLVTALARSGVAVGRAAGTVSAAGTLGSLGGTFAATHWLVPTLGCRITMTVTGALLLGAAALIAVRRGAAVAAAAGLALLASLSMLHGGPLRSPLPGRELLAERETEYQLLQVVRETSDDGPARTMLLINEGLDSYHSIAVEGSALTGGAYYDWHAIAPLLAGDGARPENLRALSIGDAAGSLRAVYAGVHPDAVVDGVDIDTETMALGAEYFGTAKANGKRFAVDGRVFVNHAEETWHVVHVDAYANQIYVPAHLASREFFLAIEGLLEPGGVVACNVGALRDDDPVLRAIATTVAEVFGHASALHVPRTRNYLLIARKGTALQPERLSGFRFGDERLQDADAESWRRIVQTAAEPRRWHDVGSDGPVLVDDRPELDELMMQSYVVSTDTGELLACNGSATSDSAELAAYEAAQHGDWAAVLAAVRGSSAATAYLREQAGNARWSLRELRSAIAEYQSGLALGSDAAVRDRLTGNVRELEAQRLPHTAAAAVATRNGWLVGAVGLVFVLGAAALYRMSRMPEAPSVSVLVDAR